MRGSEKRAVESVKATESKGKTCASDQKGIVMKSQTIPDDILLIAGVIRVAKYLYWKSEIGNEKAQAIIDEIHAGKYRDSHCGVWAQTEGAFMRIVNHLMDDSDDDLCEDYNGSIRQTISSLIVAA